MDRLAELRERRALTLRELSEMSGVAADTINQIELGHRKARPSTLRKLAKALDVDVREFFEEPALAGKAEAPREAGPPQASTQTVEEFERRLGHVLEPVRAEALRETQSAARTISSEGLDAYRRPPGSGGGEKVSGRVLTRRATASLRRGRARARTTRAG